MNLYLRLILSISIIVTFSSSQFFAEASVKQFVDSQTLAAKQLTKEEFVRSLTSNPLSNTPMQLFDKVLQDIQNVINEYDTFFDLVFSHEYKSNFVFFLNHLEIEENNSAYKKLVELIRLIQTKEDLEKFLYYFHLHTKKKRFLIEIWLRFLRDVHTKEVSLDSSLKSVLITEIERIENNIGRSHLFNLRDFHQIMNELENHQVHWRKVIDKGLEVPTELEAIFQYQMGADYGTQTVHVRLKQFKVNGIKMDMNMFREIFSLQLNDFIPDDYVINEDDLYYGKFNVQFLTRDKEKYLYLENIAETSHYRESHLDEITMKDILKLALELGEISPKESERDLIAEAVSDGWRAATIEAVSQAFMEVKDGDYIILDTFDNHQIPEVLARKAHGKEGGRGGQFFIPKNGIYLPYWIRNYGLFDKLLVGDFNKDFLDKELINQITGETFDSQEQYEKYQFWIKHLKSSDFYQKVLSLRSA